MCGIAGAMFFGGRHDDRRASTIVSAMVRALGHRGPDGQGVVLCADPSAPPDHGASVTLGHTRLAILDLSERAAQPMRLDAAPVWMTFNGEIFNFAAIRADLEARGRRFRSQSDTEVILQGYDEWGAGVLDRLQGMFAFVIWDGRTRQLLVARDRLGVKPIYTYQAGDCFLFASEIRALLATGLVPRTLDQVALDQYLSYQTVPSPRTLVKDVRMLLPGHSIVIGRGSPTERAYWDMLDNASSDGETATSSTARARVADLLEQSAALHLVSDVPVGIFLSGGIDSSALVALTRKAGAVPRTFSVVLPGSPHDEAVFAERVARRFGGVHTEIAIGERELADAVPIALAQVDHPSGDGLNTFIISRAVRAAGIKVALSGLGGDEVFGGYPSFDRMSRLARYAGAWKRSPAAVRNAAAAAVRVIGRSSIASNKAAAVLESDGTLPQTFPVTRQVFNPADRRALLGEELVELSRQVGDPYTTLLEDAARRHPQRGLLAMVSYAEARTYMHDVLLRDADQMSMAHGLEVRVPLLDHRLVEYVVGLPDAAKQPAGMPKRLLVESLGSDLPVECVQRPKQGFVLPFDAWMKGELRGFCEHHLGRQGLAGRSVVRAPAVEALWRAYVAGNRSTSWSRPWTLVALNAWLEHNQMSA
jgi:asparagine synthase (glutamine-hydrolysing)